MALQVVNISNSNVEFVDKGKDPTALTGQQIASIKLENIQLKAQNTQLGQQLAQVKFDIMNIKGGISL